MGTTIISQELLDQWSALNENKNPYAFGEAFDLSAFTQTVKETFQAIKAFKIAFFGKDMFGGQNLTIATEQGVTPGDVFDYANLLAEIGKYSADVYMDESEDHIFSASQIVTRLLLDGYAYFSCGMDPTDETGVLYGNCEDCGFYPPAEEADDDFWYENFSYDTNTGDLSEILEVVKRIFR